MSGRSAQAAVCAMLCGVTVVALGRDAPGGQKSWDLTYRTKGDTVSYLFVEECTRLYRYEKEGKKLEKVGEFLKLHWVINERPLGLEGNYLKLLVTRIPLDTQGTNDEGGVFTLRGRLAAVGTGEVPFPLNLLWAKYGFPWLPGRRVKAGDAWEETMKAGEFVGEGWGPLFPMTIRWRVEGLRDYRQRKCLEITFQAKGRMKPVLRHSRRVWVEIEAKGKYLFDVKERLEVLVEKWTSYSSFSIWKGKQTERIRQYRTMKLLSENPLQSRQEHGRRMESQNGAGRRPAWAK